MIARIIFEHEIDQDGLNYIKSYTGDDDVDASEIWHFWENDTDLGRHVRSTARIEFVDEAIE